MKYNNIKTIRKEDYGDAPDWFKEKLVPVLNELITSTNDTLNKLDFDSNFISESFEVLLKTDVEEVLTYSLKTKPKRVLFDYIEGATVLGQSWEYVGNNAIKVKLKLDRPQAKVKITLLS